MHAKILNILFLIQLTITVDDYWIQRELLIEHDKHHIIGSNLILTEKDKKVNDILINFKLQELNAGFKDPESFLPLQHFFKSKESIEKSNVFKFIKQLPKGASLHSHDEALVSQEYIYNLTLRNNLYGCIGQGNFKLRFFSPSNITDSCNWTSLNDLRKTDKKFDNYLRTKLSLIRNDPEKAYPDLNSVWSTFQNIFITVMGLVSYKQVFEDYVYQALKELYDDNVKYLEFRGFVLPVYDLEGKLYSETEVIGLYFNTMKKFQRDYPDFYGAKFIYGPNKKVDNSTMDNYINVFKKMKKSYPNFVVGFDLVGQEDLGNPLSSYIPQLMEIKNLGANFYFHAGETNWYRESTDLNLFDAILLNTTRIGHGYALLKHPAAAKLVKERKIAIEICPTSNQVLKLVSDLRNHPGTLLMANGFPVVISSDDPSFWGAKGLSYDWYLPFMAMTSKESDIRVLKQLAMNSLEYSSLDEHDKNTAMLHWKHEWDLFIDKILIEYYDYDPVINSV